MKIIDLKNAVNELDRDSINAPFVIPTETVYGLAAPINDDIALRKIFEIKGRPSDNPLIVHVSTIEQLKNLINKGLISDQYQKLIDEYWPGPLTLVFECNENVSDIIRGNSNNNKKSNTVAIRMPTNQYLRDLISKIGIPLAAPSANTSGKPSPTTVQHVIDDFSDKVSVYIDGGPCENGLESTVFGIIDNIPIILRPGPITREELQKTLGVSVQIKNKVSAGEKTICPGQKYKHYSPSVSVYLFKGENWQQNMVDMHLRLNNTTDKNTSIRVGVLASNIADIEFKFYTMFDLGNNIKDCCKNLFSGLRALDNKCDVIFIKSFDLDNEGLAIMDRLEKASTYIIE